MSWVSLVLLTYLSVWYHDVTVRKWSFPKTESHARINHLIHGLPILLSKKTATKVVRHRSDWRLRCTDEYWSKETKDWACTIIFLLSHICSQQYSITIVSQSQTCFSCSLALQNHCKKLNTRWASYSTMLGYRSMWAMVTPFRDTQDSSM